MSTSPSNTSLTNVRARLKNRKSGTNSKERVYSICYFLFLIIIIILLIHFTFYLLSPFPFPFFWAGWESPWVYSTLAYQISMRLGASSPTEARHSSPTTRTYSEPAWRPSCTSTTYVQVGLGSAVYTLWLVVQTLRTPRVQVTWQHMLFFRVVKSTMPHERCAHCWRRTSLTECMCAWPFVRPLV